MPREAFFAWIEAGKTPFMGKIAPSSPSSPITMYDFSFSFGIIPITDKIPKVIGKSKCDPSFVRSAGDKFITILLGGSCNPIDWIAERIP